MQNGLKKNLNFYLFSNQNYFTYNLFNKIYSLLKLNKKIKNQLINKYQANGFVKSRQVKSEDLAEIKIILQNSKKIKKKNLIEYEINDELRLKIKKLFIQYFLDDIKNFENYFSSNIFVTHVKISTNIGFKTNNEDKVQYYSENYHTDNYIFTYFKLFVNLEDVGDDKGPLHFVPTNNQKKFIKLSNYKNRYLYDENNIDHLIYKNVGKEGDSIFVNTTENLHKAGIPDIGKSRTVIRFELNAIPSNKSKNDLFNYENKEKNIYNDEYWSKIYAKPKGILNTILLLVNFLKEIR